MHSVSVFIVIALLPLFSVTDDVPYDRLPSLCGPRLTKAVLAVCNYRLHTPTREQIDAVRLGREGGIVDSCCRRRCTYTFLRKYCASDEEVAHMEGRPVKPDDGDATKQSFGTIIAYAVLDDLLAAEKKAERRRNNSIARPFPGTNDTFYLPTDDDDD